MNDDFITREEYISSLKLYELLERSSPEERVIYILRILENFGQPLNLSSRDGVRAPLSQINLSRDELRKILNRSSTQFVAWWNSGFQGADLHAANLQGADLRAARLQGCVLFEADLQQAILLAANLEDANLGRAKCQDCILFEANLQGASLIEADLRGADLSEANLQRAKLFKANLCGANLSRANLQNADFSEADLKGANLNYTHLEGLDLSRTSLKSIYINGAWLDKTRFHYKQLGGAVGDELEARKRSIDTKKRVIHYENARQAYLAIKQNFESLGDYEAASWAYRKERRMEKWQVLNMSLSALRTRDWLQGIRGISSFVNNLLQELICDYGESFWRVMLCMILLFLTFTIAYGVTNSVFKEDLGIRSVSSSPVDWALFSLGAMTTMEPEGLTPANIYVQIAVRSEALLTVALTGLLGFVIGNRIRRS